MDFNIELTDNELTATIEALYDAIMLRVKWTVMPRYKQWRHLDYEVAQASINLLTAAYAKTTMALLDVRDQVHPSFLPMFQIPDDVWELLNGITKAASWDAAPIHQAHDVKKCDLCKTLENV